MVADDTDRAAAEAGGFRCQDKRLQYERGIDRGVEKAFEPAVLQTVAAQFADALEPVGIAAKHQEDWCVADPRHVGNKRRQATAPGGVRHSDDRGLLEIRFRGSRECGAQQQAQQRFGHRSRCVAPMGAPHQQLAQPRNFGGLGGLVRLLAEAGAPLGIVICAHISRVDLVRWRESQAGARRPISAASNTYRVLQNSQVTVVTRSLRMSSSSSAGNARRMVSIRSREQRHRASIGCVS